VLPTIKSTNSEWCGCAKSQARAENPTAVGGARAPCRLRQLPRHFQNRLAWGLVLFRTCTQLGPLYHFKILCWSREVRRPTRNSTNLTTQPKFSRCRPRPLLRQRPLASRPGRSLTPPRRLRNGTLLRMRPSLARYVDALTFELILGILRRREMDFCGFRAIGIDENSANSMRRGKPLNKSQGTSNVICKRKCSGRSLLVNIGHSILHFLTGFWL